MGNKLTDGVVGRDSDDSSSGFQTKVSTSRSSSVQSFDEALNAGTRNVASPASTPVIPEEKEVK